jgi:hypothetical protein
MPGDGRKMNPYTQGGPPSKRNPFTRDSAGGARRRKKSKELSEGHKTDKPSDTGLRGVHPRKY